MSNCLNMEADLSAFVDGELPPARKSEIEAHVAGCTDCRRRVEELRQLAAGIAALPQMEPAPRFLDDVRRKIRAGQRTWWHVLFDPWWLKVPIEALALVAVVATVLMVANPRNPKLAGGPLAFQAERVRPVNKPVELSVAATPPANAPADEVADRLAAASEPQALRANEAGRIEKDEAEAKPVGGAALANQNILRSAGDGRKLSTNEAASLDAVSTWVVTSADPAGLQAQAADVAAEFGGQILSSMPAGWDTRSSRLLATDKTITVRTDGTVAGKRFWVELPASKAGQFLAELGRAIAEPKPAVAAQQSSPPTAAFKEEALAKSASRKLFGAEKTKEDTASFTEPRITLEIAVVPPTQ